MGSYHSLTPCVSSPGTIVDMKGLDKIVSIDAEDMTFTAQAGLEMIDAADALRTQNLQFMLNIEIGNMTLGSAACCHTKDALDGVGVRSGQFVRHRRQVGEPVGHARGSVRGAESRAAAADSRELRPGRHRLRGHVQDQAAGDRPVQLRRARRRRGHAGSDLAGHRVERRHGLLDDRTTSRHPDAQSCDRAATRHPSPSSRRFGWSFLAPSPDGASGNTRLDGG